MSSIAETTPRKGRRNFNLRAYLAGTAATAALLGAVVFAFASLGAYVAFNGLPIGGGDADTETTRVSVGEAATKTPAKARNGAANAAAAERRDGPATAQGNGSNGQTGQASEPPATAPPAPPVSGDTDAGGPTTSAGPQDNGPTQGTSAANPTDSGDPPVATIPTPHVSAPDSVGGTVGTVEQTLHDAGIDVPLNDGGAGSAVDDLTDSVLGD